MLLLFILFANIENSKELRTLHEADILMTKALVEHWRSCNMYAIRERHIVKMTHTHTQTHTLVPLSDQIIFT